MSALFEGNKPAGLGVKNARLKPCPDSPRCVSSQADDPGRYLPPLTFSGDERMAFDRLALIVEDYKNSQIVEKTSHYLHAEFQSPVFRFTDDVEFFLDADNQCIHFRSAARLGYYDFGVNRRRMEEIRNHFDKEIAKGDQTS